MSVENRFSKDQSSETVQEAIGQFVAARQRLGRPVSVFLPQWDMSCVFTPLLISRPPHSIPRMFGVI